MQANLEQQIWDIQKQIAELEELRSLVCEEWLVAVCPYKQKDIVKCPLPWFKNKDVRIDIVRWVWPEDSDEHSLPYWEVWGKLVVDGKVNYKSDVRWSQDEDGNKQSGN